MQYGMAANDCKTEPLVSEDWARVQRNGQVRKTLKVGRLLFHRLQTLIVHKGRQACGFISVIRQQIVKKIKESVEVI